ncbi:transposase family protein [Streptomyces sp. NPDC086010]|uniref:transposase family protein n=1 Tax=Streptomyces sp. NPDC086010 TaxID=3365745 RepID=UPI0037D48C1E
MSRQSATVCLIKLHTRQRRAITDLSSWLGILIDPRDRRGRRHPFVSVLLTACSAVLTGEKSFGAIGQWASGAPQDALARLGACTATTYYVRVAPSAVTIGRIINAACPGGLADLLGDNPAETDTLAVDGKSARGSRTGDSRAAYLLAAITGGGMTVI